MKIEKPELQVIRFGAEDVIATSGLMGQTGLFYVPTSQYVGGSFSGDYVEFSGTFGAYNGGGYEITDTYGAKGVPASDLDIITSKSTYLPDVGITLPNSFGANVAKQAYDAYYSYSDGQYYSNGISYYERYFQ